MGSTGSSYGSHGVAYAQPAQAAAPAYAGHAYLVLNVPKDASVMLDGRSVAGSGTTRKYRIPVGSTQKQYTYPVTVIYKDAGRVRTASYNKTIAAGRMTVVNTQPAAPTQLAAR